MASSSHRGSDYYGATLFRSREWLSTRQVASTDEIQVRIDPMHEDLDDEISGLRTQVRQRNVAQDIQSEAKSQNDFLNKLQMSLIKAQAGVKNNMRRLNKSIMHPAWGKPCCPCGCFCTSLLYCGLLLVQNFNSFKSSSVDSYLIGLHLIIRVFSIIFLS